MAITLMTRKALVTCSRPVLDQARQTSRPDEANDPQAPPLTQDLLAADSWGGGGITLC